MSFKFLQTEPSPNPSLVQSLRAHVPSVLAWWAALVLLIIGLTAPLFTIHRFWIFDNTVSLLGGLKVMLDSGEWLLFLVIGLFSVVFPLAKLISLFAAAHGRRLSAKGNLWARRLNALGHWSMLDVFVVAILVVAIKLGTVLRVEVHYGVYIFAIAVLLSLLLARWLKESFNDDQTQEQHH